MRAHTDANFSKVEEGNSASYESSYSQRTLDERETRVHTSDTRYFVKFIGISAVSVAASRAC